MREVRLEFSKWGDRPHWECDALRLGDDEHGTWLGAPVGTALTRPGVDFRADHAFVVLAPVEGSFLATFYEQDHAGSNGWVEIYVDITTRPTWVGTTLRAVDLDLDVVKGRTGRVWVDDEDEFAEHRVRFGYPDDVVAMAVETCAEVRAAVGSGAAPYDPDTHRGWLGELGRVVTSR